MKSLFGHIVLNFTSQAENLATEALYYILKNSTPARAGLSRFLGLIDTRLDGELLFKTQVYDEDAAIPDLVGLDEDYNQRCIIESKFWAGLTDNQPVTYFKRLKLDKPSILLFLVPSKRLESIWYEIVDRCKDAGMEINSGNKHGNYIYANLNENNYIAVVDWITLLTMMETELDSAGDYLLKSDLIQLKGLCHQMDEKAFLPLDSTEISPMIARRNCNFYEIVNEVIESGKSEGMYSQEGLRSAGGLYYYGHYFQYGDFLYFLNFDVAAWDVWANTPIWIYVYGKKWKDAKESLKVKNALSELESHTHNRLFIDRYGSVEIPLKVELGVDKSQIVKSIKKQIKDINQILTKNYQGFNEGD